MNSSSVKRGRLFVISAPSGAGKTSLTHAVIARLAGQGRVLRFSVSYTTRAPRGTETDAVDYHFVSQEQFLRMVASGEFLEYAQVFDRYYGTGRAKTEELLASGADVVLDIDWQGARQVRASSDDAISIFIMPPTREELARRLRERASDNDEAIARRLAEADKEITHAAEFDHVVVNDHFESAVEELLGYFN